MHPQDLHRLSLSRWSKTLRALLRIVLMSPYPVRRMFPFPLPTSSRKRSVLLCTSSDSQTRLLLPQQQQHSRNVAAVEQSNTLSFICGKKEAENMLVCTTATGRY